MLISGFIKECEKTLKLFMNVPDGIGQIMLEFYPLLVFRFGDFKKDAFHVDEDRMIIEGGDPVIRDCNGRFVYADLGQYSQTGLNKGVHFWSVKAIFDTRQTACFASIGVTTEKNNDWINNWAHDGGELYYWFPNKHNNNSHHHAGGKWRKDQIITVRLDCEKWNVIYYDGDKKIKTEDIESNQSYHFALMLCCRSAFTKYQIVETPKELCNF